jgi:hypothetical protein
MKGRPWKRAELAILKRDYPDTENCVLAVRLKRSALAVAQTAWKHGLKKSQACISANRKARLGAAMGMRFTPGQKPWNTGIKGLHHSPATEFKKGNRPWGWVPVGSLRNYGGYRQRKVADTGDMATDWRSLHVMLWESVHGEIPEGHAIVFKDRDKTHIVIENLECISRRELMRRNSYHTNYPKEITRLIQLRGAVQRQINRRQRAQ